VHHYQIGKLQGASTRERPNCKEAERGLEVAGYQNREGRAAGQGRAEMHAEEKSTRAAAREAVDMQTAEARRQGQARARRGRARGDNVRVAEDGRPQGSTGDGVPGRRGWRPGQNLVRMAATQEAFASSGQKAGESSGTAARRRSWRQPTEQSEHGRRGSRVAWGRSRGRPGGARRRSATWRSSGDGNAAIHGEVGGGARRMQQPVATGRSGARRGARGASCASGLCPKREGDGVGGPARKN
jgi:hypothetical protein